MQCKSVLVLALGLASCSQSNQTNPKDKIVDNRITVPSNVESALRRNTCLSCHKPDRKLIGPSYIEIAHRLNSTQEIISLIRTPSPEHWPNYPPMIGVNINDADGNLIGDWIMSLKPPT
jgi:cytochrome c551/c552